MAFEQPDEREIRDTCEKLGVDAVRVLAVLLRNQLLWRAAASEESTAADEIAWNHALAKNTVGHLPEFGLGQKLPRSVIEHLLQQAKLQLLLERAVLPGMTSDQIAARKRVAAPQEALASILQQGSNRAERTGLRADMLMEEMGARRAPASSNAATGGPPLARPSAFASSELSRLCEAGRFALIRKMKGHEPDPLDLDEEGFYENVSQRTLECHREDPPAIEVVHVFADGSVLFNDEDTWQPATGLDDLNERTGWRAEDIG